MTSDDAARRERAISFTQNEQKIGFSRMDDWGYLIEKTGLAREERLVAYGYLAGSREEAEIRSEEVERLESVARGLKQCCEEYRAEIAALREQLKDAHAQIEGLENELIEVREMSDE